MVSKLAAPFLGKLQSGIAHADRTLLGVQRMQASLRGDSLSGKKVTVVGGGYAGLEAAQALSARGAKVHLIDPQPAHVPITELPKVVVGKDVEVGYEELARRRGYQFTRGAVTGVDPEKQTVTLRTAAGRDRTVRYGDALTLAVGGKARGSAEGVFALRTAEEAYALREALNAKLEQSGKVPVRVAISGMGLTGVEVAGAIKQAFGDRVQVVAAGRDIKLPTENPALAELTEKKLEELGVKVIRGVDVKPHADRLELSLTDKPGAPKSLKRAGAPADGIVPADLTIDSLGTMGAAKDLGWGTERGVIATDDTLRVPGTNIWVAGDVAELGTPNAHVAETQGKLVARNIGDALAGKKGETFEEHNPGWVGSIGAHDAVGELHTAAGTVPVSSTPAVKLKEAIEARHRLVAQGLPDLGNVWNSVKG